MRVLTWNINGLRAVLKRKYGSVKALLDDLKADIVCFQETKLTKTDFDRDLALVDGWDSYFSINRGRSAYSGTATFCRESVTVPDAAQEGVTGILHSRREPVGGDDLLETGACEAAATIWEGHSREELEHIDSEGRCVVTDHGNFVLFNVYGPAISKEENAAERFAFKLSFYRALGRRMEALRSRGRRVILVGDLNISPAPIDSCDPGVVSGFLAREDRQWLRSIMDCCGGPFIDVFRMHHPERKDAYTCWQQASGARVNNWGTRIDLILAADGHLSSGDARLEVGGMRSVFVASDIWPELTGSDHCPAWADLQTEEGLSLASNPPAFSTRNNFTGRQYKLTAWLRQQPAQPAASPAEAAGASAEQNKPQLLKRSAVSLPRAPNKKAKTMATGQKSGRAPVQCSLRAFMASSRPPASRSQTADSDLAKAIAASLADRQAMSGGTAEQSEPGCGGEADESSELTAPRRTRLRRATGITPAVAGEDGNPTPDLLIADAIQEEEERQDMQQTKDFPGGLQRGKQSSSDAAAAWRAIQDKMKPPRCRGHNEECVIRQVKKKGPNFGRLFYVCRRADGPPPEGRCDFFVWSGSREVRGSQTKQPSRSRS